MGGIRTWLNNNLGQRNLSVVKQEAGGRVSWPFIAGHSANEEPYMEIVIDRTRLPRQVDLFLDPNPQAHYFPTTPVPAPSFEDSVLLDRTRLLACICGTRGILILEAGSKFACAPRASEVRPRFGAKCGDDGRLKIEANRAVIGVSKKPGETCVMALHFPASAEGGSVPIGVDVSQRNPEGRTVGGASIDVRIR